METLKGPPPSSAAGSCVLERPSLPKEKDAAACDIETLIKDIRRWCEQQLPAAMKLYPKLAKICEDKEFWQCAPLSIKESENGALVGHKEPFDQHKCSIATRERGMYEASMNIAWVESAPCGQYGQTNNGRRTDTGRGASRCGQLVQPQ